MFHHPLIHAHGLGSEPAEYAVDEGLTIEYAVDEGAGCEDEYPDGEESLSIVGWVVSGGTPSLSCKAIMLR